MICDVTDGDVRNMGDIVLYEVVKLEERLCKVNSVSFLSLNWKLSVVL